MDKYSHILDPRKAAELKQRVYDILGCAIRVHKEMGPGLNEYMYQEALAIALRKSNIPFVREYPFKVTFMGEEIQHQHRMDFWIRDEVDFECKAVENLCDEHRQQLWNYMRLTNTEIGVLFNFAPHKDQCEKYYYDRANKVMHAF